MVSKIIVRLLPHDEQTSVGGGAGPEKLPRLLSQSGLDRILFDTRSGSACLPRGTRVAHASRRAVSSFVAHVRLVCRILGGLASSTNAID